MIMKTFLFTCLLSCLAFFGYAETQANVTDSLKENPRERQTFRQRMHAQRVAFFTERMGLTPAEAERFWPLYNRYHNEREKLLNEFLQKTHVKRDSVERGEFDISKLSDADARRLVANEGRRIELERKFHQDLTKIFPPQRVLAFYDAERSFQRELMQTRHRREIETRREVVPQRGRQPEGNPSERRRPTE
jgi:hypothetical protein